MAFVRCATSRSMASFSVDAPGLRIVSDELWYAPNGRLARLRAHLETITGSRGRGRDVESRFLLSGFARCAMCGASFYPTSRSHGRERAFFYACSAYHKRGTAVCGNSLSMRIERVDDAVLQTLGGDVLRSAVVMAFSMESLRR